MTKQLGGAYHVMAPSFKNENMFPLSVLLHVNRYVIEMELQFDNLFLSITIPCVCTTHFYLHLKQYIYTYYAIVVPSTCYRCTVYREPIENTQRTENTITEATLILWIAGLSGPIYCRALQFTSKYHVSLDSCQPQIW